MWIAFLPTYFTSDYSAFKVLYIVIVMIVNGTVTLAFLFVPKIIALYFYNVGQINVPLSLPSNSLHTSNQHDPNSHLTVSFGNKVRDVRSTTRETLTVPVGIENQASGSCK